MWTVLRQTLRSLVVVVVVLVAAVAMAVVVVVLLWLSSGSSLCASRRCACNAFERFT